MKKYALIIVAIIITLVTIIYKKKQSKKYTIAIIQCASNKALNLLANSFIKKINELLGSENITIIYKNAEGSVANAHTIGKQLHLNKNINLFFTIGSSVSQAIATLENNRPIIIAGVSNPHAYNLEKNNICGTIDTIDEKTLINMINYTHSNINKIGLLRTAGNINEEEFSYFKKLCKEKDKEVKDFAVNSESEIISIIENICQKIELLIIPCDSLVVSILPYIIKITKKYKIPVFTCFIEGIYEGAFASTGLDYELNGIISAEIAIKIILKKLNIQDIKFKKIDYQSIYYNKKLFDFFNIKISLNENEKNNIKCIDIK